MLYYRNTWITGDIQAYCQTKIAFSCLEMFRKFMNFQSMYTYVLKLFYSTFLYSDYFQNIYQTLFRLRYNIIDLYMS